MYTLIYALTTHIKSHIESNHLYYKAACCDAISYTFSGTLCIIKYFKVDAVSIFKLCVLYVGHQRTIYKLHCHHLHRFRESALSLKHMEPLCCEIVCWNVIYLRINMKVRCSVPKNRVSSFQFQSASPLVTVSGNYVAVQKTSSRASRTKAM